MTKVQVTTWLYEFLTDEPLCRDDYDEWASSAIQNYGSLLTEIGCEDIAVFGGQPNGDYVDEIRMRDALGNECVVPDPDDDFDPEDEDEAEDYIKPVVEFFLALHTLKSLPEAQRVITATSIEALCVVDQATIAKLASGERVAEAAAPVPGTWEVSYPTADGSFTASDSMSHAMALKLVQERFGADSEGRVCLLNKVSDDFK